jgi:uncharacterized protein YbjQ (UPF0145 family)
MANEYSASNKEVIVVSNNYIPGYRIEKVIGHTWGLILISRGLGGNISVGLKSIVHKGRKSQ